MNKLNEIDDLDRQILSMLMEDANVPYTELAKKLYVSGGTIHVRMKKLKQLGIVSGAYLKIDYTKLGYDVVAFLGIYLDKSSLYKEASEQLFKIPEVTGAHYTTGLYNIFAKVVCKDTKHLRDVLHKIQGIAGIQRTETFISLEEGINRPVNLLKDAKELRG